MNGLDPRALAAIAASAPNHSSFASELLDRLQRTIGYDVAYHAHAPLGREPVFAARRGLADDIATRMLRRNAVYAAELDPIKRAAAESDGVAVDSAVLSRSERDARAYYRELMAPAGGRHALLAVAVVTGQVAAVTMLGRTGATFSARALEAVRRVVPVIGLAARAHAFTPPPASSVRPTVSLTRRERDLCDYVALGFTNDEIGKALGTSPRTVRNQLSALYMRLGVANRAELVALAGR